MSTKSSNRALIILMSILLAATGCAVDEDSVGQYLSLPPEIEIVGLESARDRSGMRGPQYFSFLCDGATFSQIVLLNEFESYENFPSQLPTEWKALADIVVKTEKVRSWPEAEVIDRHTVYSDVGRIADQPDNAQLVRFAFHVNDRGYFVVFDAH